MGHYDDCYAEEAQRRHEQRQIAWLRVEKALEMARTTCPLKSGEHTNTRAMEDALEAHLVSAMALVTALHARG